MISSFNKIPHFARNGINKLYCWPDTNESKNFNGNERHARANTHTLPRRRFLCKMNRIENQYRSRNRETSSTKSFERPTADRWTFNGANRAMISLAKSRNLEDSQLLLRSSRSSRMMAFTVDAFAPDGDSLESSTFGERHEGRSFRQSYRHFAFAEKVISYTHTFTRTYARAR